MTGHSEAWQLYERGRALAELATRPSGGRLLKVSPVNRRLMEGAGLVTCDPATGKYHLTRAGWRQAAADRAHSDVLASIRDDARTEAALRQGPIDATGIRRLSAAFNSTIVASARLYNCNDFIRGAGVAQEARQILDRLAVVCGVPLDLPSAEVLSAAHHLAAGLDRMTEAQDGNVASVDPRGRLERRGVEVPGDPSRNPWRLSVEAMARALLVS